MRIILGGVDTVDEGRHPANEKRIGDERRSRQLFDVFMKYDFVDMSEAYVDWIDMSAIWTEPLGGSGGRR